MNLRPHKMSREHSAEPLHQTLLNFGKGLWQWPMKPADARVAGDVADEMLLLQQADNAALQARARELTVKQLTTTLRMQHEHSEELVMLGSLESLALAGEITFQDFIRRTQNLFPKAMESLDVALRTKVTALMM